MFAEIIAIGTELTTGAKLDTNSQWLSQQLAAEGVEVLYHSTVADNLEANQRVLRNSVDRVQLVLITGGLGPTLDDLTRQVIAEMLQVPLVLDAHSLAIIESMFARRKRPMPERNRIQAMFPEGSEVIPNPRGTAPGIWVEIKKPDQPPTYLAALPGVPTEMKGMFLDWVVPRLKSLGSAGKCILSHRLNCFGLGESQAEEMLGDLTARGRDPEVGITVHEGTITLRIEAHGATREESLLKISDTARLARERLGPVVFGEEDEELEDVLLRYLTGSVSTLATLEIGSGGLLAERLNSAEIRIGGNRTRPVGCNTLVQSPPPQTGPCYRGGVVLSAPPFGHSLLAVNSPSCSSEQAEISSLEPIARELRSRLQATYCLVIGPFPPDDPATSEVPVTEIGLLSDEFYVTRQLHLGGDPAILKSRVAKAALNLLRLHWLGELRD